MSSIPSQGNSEHARKEDVETEDFKRHFASNELNKIDWLAHIGWVVLASWSSERLLWSFG